MKRIYFFPLLCMIMISACSNEKLEVYSIVNLISSPYAIDGRRIRTYGYVRIEEENTAIYLSEDSARYGIYAEGVWLKLNYSGSKTISDWAYLDKQWVAIEGKFRNLEKGHFGLFVGSIVDIGDIQILKPELEVVQSEIEKPGRTNVTD